MAKAITCFLVTSTQGSTINQTIVDESRFTVGRSIEATLAFPDPNISRMHLEVKLKNDVVTIEDKGSANGTFVGDTQLTPNIPVELSVGDVIRFGKSEISMQIQVFEKTFPKDAAKNPALNKDGSKLIVQLIEAAHAEAARVIKHSQDHVHEVARVAQEKATTLIEDAELQRKQIIEKGHSDADALVQEGRQKASRVLKNAEDDAEQAKSALQKELAEEREKRMALMNAEAAAEIEKKQNAAEKALLEANTKSEIIINEAQKKSQEILSSAESKSSQMSQESSKLIQDSQKKADEIISVAQTKSDEIIRAGELKSAQIAGSAQSQADALVAKYLDEAREKAGKDREELLRATKAQMDQDLAKKLRDLQFGWEKEKAEKVRNFEADFGSRTKALENELLVRKYAFEKEESERKVILGKNAAEIAETSKILDQLKIDKNTLEPKVIEARAEFEAKTREALAQKKIYNELLEGSKNEEARLRKMREDLFSLDQQINQRRNDYERLKDQEKLQLEAIEDLDRKKHFAQDDFDEVMVKLNKANDDFQKRYIEIETNLKFEKDRMQKEKESLAFAIQLENEKLKRELESEVIKVKREHERVLSELQSYKDESYKVQTDLTEAQTSLKALQPQYLTMKDELAQYQAKKESLEKAIQANQDAFDNSMKAFRDHEAETAKIRADHDERLNLTRQDYEKATDQLKALKSDIQTAKELNEKLNVEFKKITQERDAAKGDIDKMLSKKSELEAEFKNYTQRNNELKNQVSNLEFQLNDKTVALSDTDKEYQKQMALYKSKMEEEQRKIQKEQSALTDEMKLAEVNRISKIKDDMLAELANRKDSIIKQAHRDIEFELAKHIDSSVLRGVSSEMEKVLRNSFEGSTASIMTASNAESSNPSSLIAKKRRERFAMAALGVLIGLAVMPAYNILEKQVNASSYQAAVDQKIKKEKEDYESRRYLPEQDEQLRPNYTDSVIFTKGFVARYADDKYQGKFNNAAIDYFLDKWRVEEEVTIRATAVVYSLINALEEKRRNIHPDFVKENVAKMRELESDTIKRLEEILGSKVRLEAFKKFEKKFYEKEDGSRYPANKDQVEGKDAKPESSKAEAPSLEVSDEEPPTEIEIAE